MPAKSNAWIYLLVGASCLLLGFAASTLAYRMHLLEVPGSPFIARLDREVHLTPAQRDQVEDIMRATRYRVVQAHHDFQRTRHKLFWEAFTQIRTVLTPDQQKIYDRDFRPPSESASGFWHHGPPGEGMMGEHMMGGPGMMGEPVPPPPPASHPSAAPPPHG